MNILNALGATVDTLKKYNDSLYVRYDDVSSGNDYKTPQDYGAGGKGFTDDTAAINKAIEENNVVYIPSGTYNISSPIIIGTSGKKVYGTPNTVIVVNGCDGMTIANPYNTEVSGLQFVGDNSNHHGIVLAGSGYRCNFTDLCISEFGGDAFRTNWFGDGFGVCVIEKCKITNCGNGIVFLSDANDQRNNITIRNNLFGNINDTAVRITGVGYIVEGNDIEKCKYGIRVHNWDLLPTRDDVHFAGSHALRIVGNYMEAARRAFISLSFNQTEEPKMYAGVRSVSIENNYMFSAAGHERSDEYVMVEFVTNTPESGMTFSDISYRGNMAVTDGYLDVITINGNNLLSNDCQFIVPVYGTVVRLVNMGDAVVVNNNAGPDANAASQDE